MSLLCCMYYVKDMDRILRTLVSMIGMMQSGTALHGLLGQMTKDLNII